MPSSSYDHARMKSIPGDTPYVFAGPGLERLAERRRDSAWLAAALAAADTCFVPMQGPHNTVIHENGTPRALLLSQTEAGPLFKDARGTMLLGSLAGRVCFALNLDEQAALPRGEQGDLRQLGVLMDDTELALLGYARALTHWHQQNVHCGRCGAATLSVQAGHARDCPACGNQLFPRLDPAIIVLVTHGERCLLGRQPVWVPKRYATLAGFVEPGESLEAAVRREVAEETDVRVGEVIYQASQPWPFPSSLMLGFRAEAESTTIHCKDGELEHAAWFSRDDLIAQVNAGGLLLSPSRSISYRLIRGWFEESAGYSFDAVRYVDPTLATR
jgi:NAD+ diphosphatase